MTQENTFWIHNELITVDSFKIVINFCMKIAVKETR